MTKKIFRSEKDRMIAGICGGIGEYFNVDSTLIRILFAFVLLSGSGFFLYIILWAVIPTESQIKGIDKQSDGSKGTFFVNEFDTKKEKKNK